MKNPFKRKKPAPVPEQAVEIISAPEIEPPQPQPEPEEPDDGFDEWFRTPTRGGIERRERNDIFEEYCIYGADQNGALTCRRFHRYPEHERDFDLSYSRALSFDEFNRRLLAELDKGDMPLADYHRCIKNAERLSPDSVRGGALTDLNDDEKRTLEAFCDGMDTLTNRSYLHGEGTLSCECESVVGGERLQIRFRKPLQYDALNAEVSGVSRKPIEGYDIESLWIMSVYNRLRDRSASCKCMLLTSEWSLKKEAVHLMIADGFDGIDGTLIIAVGDPAAMSRMGFWSFGFSV